MPRSSASRLGGDQRVTFVNSAIEAMDTGLTLARLATGRARVLVEALGEQGRLRRHAG
jgi:glutamate-1-semialdehyde aminotransferase